MPLRPTPFSGISPASSQWARRKREGKKKSRGKGNPGKPIGNLGDIRAAQIAAGEAMAARGRKHHRDARVSIDAERVTLNKERASVEAKERRLDAGIRNDRGDCRKGSSRCTETAKKLAVDSTEKTKQEKVAVAGTARPSRPSARGGSPRWKALGQTAPTSPPRIASKRGRTAAMAEAREEIASRFPRGSAQWQCVRPGISSEASRRLKNGRRRRIRSIEWRGGEASDVNRLRTEGGSRSGRNDGPLEQ